MDIPYAPGSSFLSECQAVIRCSANNLAEGRPVRIELGPRGYPGVAVVIIRSNDQGFFKAEWHGADSTRFPARIRAATTALRSCGWDGRFQISHKDGTIEITRISATN